MNERHREDVAVLLNVVRYSAVDQFRYVSSSIPKSSVKVFKS